MTRIRIIVAGGTGNVGSNIVRALLADKDYEVTILRRVGSQSKRLDELRALGAKVTSAVDYNRHAELVQAMQNTDILISAIDFFAIPEYQPKLFRAAKEAGVRRVVPSDYSQGTAAMQKTMYKDPDVVMRSISDVGLEYTRYFCGWFYDFLLTKEVGIDLEHHKALVYGSGEMDVSVIQQYDLGCYIAASLKDPRSTNAVFHFQGDAVTYRQLVALVEKYSGTPMAITWKSLDPAYTFRYHGHIPEEEQACELGHATEQGLLALDKPDNDLFPSVQCLPLETYLANTLVK
ncbi:hypothetical protein THASP1DRAFT_22040 [Thamnocephalis sphaerospora]|uniref:NmrA-like domain-containing protein n=1 Tax=Thamnocephalis sphaerospora TaxID=78915 RepID=A0A4P9XXQ5_9FUNG|nr:hypothetical protein THASP1DRAFT_22040 [Thamnocephalis sphaerospora]|eukprot:RKP10200.1 hypothetical protein THASP1DRAFT_22040 [Thamnocephalis sphaerospora]